MANGERIVILDFGGQYNELIARRVRDIGVYSEVYAYNAPAEEYREGLIGIILTGGPQSIYEEGALQLPDSVLELGVPILGICYGMHALAHRLGGQVGPGLPEYGATEVIPREHPLNKNIREKTVMFMNHGDRVQTMPEGFINIASTTNCPIAAMANDAKRIYAVQYHPEAAHSLLGMQVFRNFVYDICGAKGGYAPDNAIEEMVGRVREESRGEIVLCALSGGVDSSVAAALAARAIGDRLTCVFVDHGLLREDESEEVMRVMSDKLGVRVLRVDARERFLKALAGIVDPEQKRRIIGHEFIRVFEEKAREIGASYLLQGTIYPDIIESGQGPSATIKSHHNVGGMPSDIEFRGVIEPLDHLFKDEVRRLGEALGIPHDLVWRQPFPGPGLAIRIIGDVTPEKLEKVRKSDLILREEVKAAGLEGKIWQYFTVLPGVKTVGLMGDDRTYDDLIAIRAVASKDAMSVEWAEIPPNVLARISSRITNEVRGVNRVVYDITSKPPATIEWE